MEAAEASKSRKIANAAAGGAGSGRGRSGRGPVGGRGGRGRGCGADLVEEAAVGEESLGEDGVDDGDGEPDQIEVY